MLRIDVRGRNGERLPVEAAFQQQRTTGVFGALETFLQLGFEALELFRAQAAFTGGVSAKLSQQERRERRRGGRRLSAAEQAGEPSGALFHLEEIGRASCRERVFKDV